METRAAAANPAPAVRAASRDHRLRGYGRLAVILAGIRSLVFIDMLTSELAPADCAFRLASAGLWGAGFPRRWWSVFSLGFGALEGGAFPRRSCSVFPLASGALEGGAFPRRSFLAPQSRHHRAPLARGRAPQSRQRRAPPAGSLRGRGAADQGDRRRSWVTRSERWGGAASWRRANGAGPPRPLPQARAASPAGRRDR